MFTWICPKCGREVPPAYDECPDCARAQQAGGQPPAAGEPATPPAQAPMAVPQVQYQAPPAPQQMFAPPQAQYPPPQAPQQAYPQIPQMPYYPPPPRRRAGLPAWALTPLFALAFLGVGAAAYWIVGYFRGGSQAAPSTSVESPAAKAGAAVNPLQKYIEISGVRFVEDPKNKEKILAKFLVTNHSQADLQGLAGNVTIWGRTQKSEEEAQGTFSFTASLGPWESKELSAPITTKYKIYELPDWQNLNPDLQITAPAPNAQ